MKQLFLLLFVSLALFACEKIIAEDISGEMPVLIVPTSGSTTASNPVHFKWEKMPGAEKYHLMVVSPSFANVQSYVLDTLVTGTEFYYSLDSNQYELKLVGVNAGYRSDTLGPIPFNVNASSGGTSNTITLSAPLAQAAENGSFNNQFSWQSNANATSYEFSLRTGLDFATGTIVQSTNNITTTNYTVPTTLSEGEYTWGVKAYLSVGETAFSTRQFYIDATNPNTPALSTPLNNDFVNQGPVTFVWNNGSDPGAVNTEVTSFVEIASNSSFLTPEFSPAVVGNTVTVTITTPGVYYWRVTNEDAAGNAGTTSSVQQFTVLL